MSSIPNISIDIPVLSNISPFQFGLQLLQLCSSENETVVFCDSFSDDLPKPWIPSVIARGKTEYPNSLLYFTNVVDASFFQAYAAFSLESVAQAVMQNTTWHQTYIFCYLSLSWLQCTYNDVFQALFIKVKENSINGFELQDMYFKLSTNLKFISFVYQDHGSKQALIFENVFSTLLATNFLAKSSIFIPGLRSLSMKSICLFSVTPLHIPYFLIYFLYTCGIIAFHKFIQCDHHREDQLKFWYRCSNIISVPIKPFQ